MAKRPEASASSPSERPKKDKAPKSPAARPRASAAERRFLPPDERDFKAMMARVNRDGWKAFHILSTELDRPIQRMLVEAMNDYLEKHGRKPVVESRGLPKD